MQNRLITAYRLAKEMMRLFDQDEPIREQVVPIASSSQCNPFKEDNRDEWYGLLKELTLGVYVALNGLNKLDYQEHLGIDNIIKQKISLEFGVTPKAKPLSQFSQGFENDVAKMIHAFASKRPIVSPYFSDLEINKMAMIYQQGESAMRFLAQEKPPFDMGLFKGPATALPNPQVHVEDDLLASHKYD